MSRVVVALAAVAVLAWLAVLERDLRLQLSALREAGAGRVAQAHADLRRARLLNVDAAPALSDALLYFGRNQHLLAVGAVNGVLRDQPQNLVAWTRLLMVAGPDDDADRQRALDAVQRLDPIDFKAG